MFKRISFISLIFLFFVGLVFYGTFAYMNYRDCTDPIKFSIGNVDPKFGVDRAKLKDLAIAAGNRWNTALGKTVYEYDPNGKLKINLVYDQRQQEYDSTKQTLSKLNMDYANLADLNNKIEGLVKAYEKDLNDYNSQVSYWNKRGGAPTATYNNLNSWASRLEAQRTYINKLLATLNITQSNYNFNVGAINTELKKKQNQLVEGGIYSKTENKIEIYTFENEQALELLLMHELGHAKSMTHATSTDSVMSPVMSAVQLKKIKPTTEDIKLLGTCTFMEFTLRRAINCCINLTKLKCCSIVRKS